MKKIIKQLMAISLVLGAVLFVPAIVSYAADGTIAFSDPTGKVGEEITIKVKMEAGGAAIGDGQATISYDSSKLEFISGTNATNENGTVQLSASGTGTETELNFELKFKALAEGETTIETIRSTAYLFSDETLNLVPGTGTVKIEAGNGTTESTGLDGDGEREVSEANIDVMGTKYGIYENFTDALIPEGFSKTTISYNGNEHNAIQQDSSGKVMVYLIAGSNDPVIALYDETDSSFTIAEQISLGEEFYIFLLGERGGSTLPEQFQETVMEINGTSFPAWQNTESKEYFLVYALSSEGKEGYYQYDSAEGTYQRYIVKTTEEVEEKTDHTILEKIKNWIEPYFLIVLAAAVAVILLLLIILIVLAVKLKRRNAELEEFYDSYDEEESEIEPTVKDKSRKQFVGYEEDEYEDDFLEDDDEYDDEYSDEYEDEYDDEYEDEYDDEYEDEYDEDDEDKQDYGVDFIDI